jgi:hypothetical protein
MAGPSGLLHGAVKHRIVQAVSSLQKKRLHASDFSYFKRTAPHAGKNSFFEM